MPRFNAPVPLFKTMEVAPVELPRVIVLAAASAPTLMAPVPVISRLPEPTTMSTAVAPVALPIVTA